MNVVNLQCLEGNQIRFKEDDQYGFGEESYCLALTESFSIAILGKGAQHSMSSFRAGPQLSKESSKKQHISG